MIYYRTGIQTPLDAKKVRGGTLRCELTGNGRITIGGEAVLVAVAEVVAV